MSAMELTRRFGNFLLVVAALVYVLFDAFGGVIRHYLAGSSAVYATYTPALLGIVALVVCIPQSFASVQTLVRSFFALLLMATLVLLASYLGRTWGQIGFGLYILLPAFLAFALVSRNLHGTFLTGFAIAFVFAVIGVLLNTYVQFPWSGTSYEVMGIEREAARAWTSGEQDRLGGFTRASFTAAAHILLGFCALEYRTRNFALKVLLWGLGLVAIYYTNAKSTLLAMAVLPITYLIVGRITDIGEARQKRLATLMILFWILFTFAGPLLSVTYGTQIYPYGAAYGSQYDSLADRVLNTWPDALQMIDWNDPLNIVFGRGLGGIGAAQAIFEAKSNPADNIAIYLLVSFGLMALWFPFRIMRGGYRALDSGAPGRRDFVLIIAMLGIGAAASVLESIFPVMVLGMALGYPAPAPAVEEEDQALSEAENTAQAG